MASENRCPVAGCGTPIAEPRYMCPRHWFRVPKRLRDAIWGLYRYAPGSDDHLAALGAALEHVNGRIRGA